MLTPWKGSYDQPRQHIKKQRFTFLTKVHLVKAMVFPVVMYGCDSWTIKNAEHWRIDAFELWCWRRLSRVPWTGRRSNRSILKEINPEYSLEGLMLKLKLQYFGQLMRRTPWKRSWCWERLKAGGKGDDRMRWLDGITTRWTWVWENSRRPSVLCSPCGPKESGTTEWLNWTELRINIKEQNVKSDKFLLWFPTKKKF